MSSVNFTDIETAVGSSGAEIVSRDENGITIRIPYLIDFAYSWGAANSEWESEGAYFLDARVELEAGVYRFDYAIEDEEE
jgi:hypothetical protein